MGALDDGLADVSVPSPETVEVLRMALDAHMRADVMRGGSRDYRAEAKQRAADSWLSELERAVLRR